ncbi:MAG: hypothetical protein MUC53_01035 [Candidatus Contendobacter sp.]|nr:hypothetical protein [Candidatus Contendobacter sp.]
MSTDPRKMIIRLWERMTALYGSRWGIEYGPALTADSAGLAPVARIWADSLAEIPPDRVAAALRVCTDERTSEHPPTLPEFLRLCRAKTARGPAAAVPLVKLPAEYYEMTPASRCAALAADLAATARADLHERLHRAADQRQRDSISKAYWLSKIGDTSLGGPMAAHIASLPSPPAMEAA